MNDAIICDELKKILKEPKELSSILNECNYKTIDIINSLNYLYSHDEINKSIDKNDNIFFSINVDYKKEIDTNNLQNKNNNTSYHNISKLARKFRSSRYHVERDLIVNNLSIALKLTKKDNIFFIFYISSIDFFKTSFVFNDILQIDSSIRIVSPDESIKLAICKIFDDFIKKEYGENGYNDFRKKHSFKILTMEQFFKKTTWRNLIN